MKKFFKEFKEFISRGSVLDLAVGVIIGGAFTAIITALTEHILRPLINWLIGGSGDITAYTVLKAVYDANNDLDLASSIYIDWGAFISAIINFLLIALILFCIIKAVNKAREAADALKKGSAVFSKEEIKALKKQGKSKAEIKALEEEKIAEQKAAEEAAAEEAAKNAPPTTEQLLEQIRDLLAEKK